MSPGSLSGINLTLRWTSGTSWRRNALNIWPESSAYSCITTIPDDVEDNIYVIYEKGTNIYTETISMVKISLNKSAAIHV